MARRRFSVTNANHYSGSEGRAQGFQGAVESIERPAGVDWPSPEHEAVWRDLTACRAPGDWNPGDLLLLARLVFLHADAAKLDRLIAQSGTLISDQRGRVVASPALWARASVLTSMARLAGMLGLHAGTDRATLANRAAAVAAARDAMDLDDDLLARAEPLN